ncbi:MAG: hypothetical protein LM567_06750 [Desulfurococcaceae archaeon]|jgi:hypothetical protein|nr:hypothetical protein [Desulfurococcaceae archaeon]
MREKSILLVLSVNTNKSLDWALRVINSKRAESTWIIVDEKTMRILAKRNIVGYVSEKIFVYSGKRPEEFSLRVIALVKPDEVYVCDERGLLEPLIKLIRVMKIKVYEC